MGKIKGIILHIQFTPESLSLAIYTIRFSGNFSVFNHLEANSALIINYLGSLILFGYQNSRRRYNTNTQWITQ